MNNSKLTHALEAAGSAMYADNIGNGFIAAIGRSRGCYAATAQAMREHGFICTRLATFPLGADAPADHLRHDGYGIPSCCWLLADFQPDDGV